MDELDRTPSNGSLGGASRPVNAIMRPAASGDGRIRIAFALQGRVQGVGFRPFVYRLSEKYGLSGWVRNHPGGVEIEVQGAREAVARFRESLLRPPAPAAVADCRECPREAVEHESGFLIRPSDSCGAAGAIMPDIAVCGDCLNELFDPANRRYRHAFVNCTQCGPRYTITKSLPYDRGNTAMASFSMCRDCSAEYSDPRNRRFHAQPNACTVCGPKLSYRGASRCCVDSDPIAEAWGAIRQGRIVAVRGVGGFHLVCDAASVDAVARLRRCKKRPAKPFAIMVPGYTALARIAKGDREALHLLSSIERPIVLMEKTADCDDILAGVAPGLRELGVMLPYAPVHYLLFQEANGRPTGTAWLDVIDGPVLVVTSGNRRGEPLVTTNEEALDRLSEIADGFLLHDREILTRCDDSVRHRGGTFVRRARGYVPGSVRLSVTGHSVLALGGGLKNTVCLTRGGDAIVSQHLGDLDNRAGCVGLDDTVSRLRALIDVDLGCIARDMHPDFHSSRFAERLAADISVQCVAVQHHHAHIASVMAEHGLTGPVLGLALDGYGLGTDGKAWGGELLRVDGSAFSRLGHLRALPMPGGDAAAREPWRMGAAALHVDSRTDEVPVRFPGPAAEAVQEMLKRDVRTPPTTSAGRLFDAAAALLGVCYANTFESEAAMRLEALAAKGPRSAPWRDGYSIGPENTLDMLPLLRTFNPGGRAAKGAAVFHATFAAGLAEWVLRAADEEGLRQVVLGGGCFLNRTLAQAVRELLAARGVCVYEALRMPPNDGGLSLGQAWVATLQTL